MVPHDPFLTSSLLLALHCQRLCSQYSKVKRCRVILGEGGRTRGFAFVRTKTEAGATRLVEALNGFRHAYGGTPKQLKVCRWSPRPMGCLGTHHLTLET